MNLIASTSTFGFFTLISRVLGYVRDILIAIFLGTSIFADAFFVAFRLPNTFRRLFAEGTFNAAFIPSYTGALTKSKVEADSFAKEVFNLLFIILFFFVIVAEIFMPQLIFLIAPGFYQDPEKLKLAVELSRITFPFLLFICLASFFAAILNSYNKFAAAAAAPIILNVLLIAALFFSQWFKTPNVVILSYAVAVAGFLQLLILLFFVRKNFKPILSIKIKIDEKIKFFFRKLLPSIFSSGVTQINILVGTIIASFQAGAVSYLYYADRVYQINLAVAGIAVGTVMLPELSKHVKNNNFGEITNLQNRALELCLFLSIPAAVALVLASEQIITSLFGYGSFNNNSVVNTAMALTFFAFGVPAFSILKIFSNYFFARNDTKTPFYLSVMSVILNIMISISFFNKLGFVIIPIATSIASWINVFFHFYFIRKRNFHYFDKSFFYKFPRIILSVVVMGIILYLLLGFFSDKFEYNESWKFVYLFTIVIISLLSYFFVSNFSGAFKFKDIKFK
ncbi:MAG: murein biosynthesis integral membrane protein MurJ [Candidatus Pelagibacterales bacterium]|nr:MAG: murein biosynthesis integral membrane protein MurJ [Pelagibacterales bacterium]